MQSVVSPTADPGVASLIPDQSYTFVEIDYEIVSTVILLLPLIQEGLLSPSSTDSRRIIVSYMYKQKYVQKVLVKGIVKLAQEKSVVRSTVHLDMTIAVDWGVKHQTKQTKCTNYILLNGLRA